MTKLSRFIVAVGVLALTFCMMLVPCSAIGFGTASSVGGTSVEYMPAYIENIHYSEYAFTNNSIQGDSSGRFEVNLIDYFTFNTSSDGSYSAVSLYNESGIGYDGTISIMTNEFVFDRGALTSNYTYPYLYVRTGEFGVPLGNARCVYYTTVNSGESVSSFTDEFYVAFSDDIINGGKYITLDTETYDVITSHSYHQADVIEMRIEVYWDSTFLESDYNGLVCDCTLDYGDTVFVDSYSNPVYVETVDVYSWLPSTVDTFLNVEFLPGLSFGTLLVMVIAIPALFAVLKMLGGGG